MFNFPAMQLQHSYLTISRSFGQNWHLGASADATDNARSSTIARSSNAFAPEMTWSNSFITLVQW